MQIWPERCVRCPYFSTFGRSASSDKEDASKVSKVASVTAPSAVSAPIPNGISADVFAQVARVSMKNGKAALEGLIERCQYERRCLMSGGVCHASDLTVHPDIPCRSQGLPQDLRHHQQRLEGARMTKFNSLRRSDEAIEPGGVRAENLVHQKKKGALLAKGAHRENGALQASAAILQQKAGEAGATGALLQQ